MEYFKDNYLRSIQFRSFLLTPFNVLGFDDVGLDEPPDVGAQVDNVLDHSVHEAQHPRHEIGRSSVVDLPKDFVEVLAIFRENWVVEFVSFDAAKVFIKDVCASLEYYQTVNSRIKMSKMNKVVSIIAILRSLGREIECSLT